MDLALILLISIMCLIIVVVMVIWHNYVYRKELDVYMKHKLNKLKLKPMYRIINPCIHVKADLEDGLIYVDNTGLWIRTVGDKAARYHCCRICGFSMVLERIK